MQVSNHREIIEDDKIYPISFYPFPKIDDIRGDRDAIIERLLPPVLEIATTFALKYNLRQELEDLKGEASFHLVEITDKYEQKKQHFLSFLRTILWRKLVDYVRLNFERRIDVWRAAEFSRSLMFLEDRTTYEGRVGKLFDACLSDQDRIILTMTLTGSSRKDIAEFLCVSQKSVRDGAIRILNAPYE